MNGGFGSNILVSPQRGMQMLSLSKTGLGTPVLSGSCAPWCTVTDNGVGDYTINLAKLPLEQVPEVALGVVTAASVANVFSKTKLAIRIKTFAITDGTTAKEADFDIAIFGSLARDLIAPGN